MDDVFGIAVAFALSVIITNYSSRFKYLPKVTIYLVIGIITGHSILNLISSSGVDALYILKEFAHGIMIFIIGQEFTVAKIKKIEKKVFVVSLYEIAITFSFVFAGLYVLSGSLPKAVFAGIIATATAPVSTLVVLREQASEGKLTTFIKGMTGISNLFALVVFISVFPIINHFILSPAPNTLFKNVAVFSGLISVGGSILCGIVLGVLISLWEVKEHKDANKVFVVFVAIIVAISLTKIFGLNDLIIFIIMGVSHANTTSKKNELKGLIQKVDLPFYVLFFILTGAYLPLKQLSTLSFYGIGYIVLRTAGKYLGIWLGAKRLKLGKKFTKLMPLTMFSHETVAIGLTAFALTSGGGAYKSLSAVILASIVFFELIGPVLLKYSIAKSGESPIGTVVKSRKKPYTSSLEVLKGMFTKLGLIKTKQINISSCIIKDTHALDEAADFQHVMKFIETSTYDTFPVVSKEGYFVGAISYFDIKDIAFDPVLTDIVRATDIARSELFVDIDEPLESIIQKFKSGNNAYLPAVHYVDSKAHLVGYLSQKDILSNYLIPD